MRKAFVFLLLLGLGATGVAKAQKDSTKVKTGWTFGLLPTVSFDQDRGFQYGGLVNFYHYGDGSRYPQYNHSLYAEISRYTKGSGINRFMYDSDQLLPGYRLTVDLSYLTEQALDLWGFNGYEAVVNKDWEDDGSADYRSRMFYKYENNFFRFKADIQHTIGESDFNWIVGFNLLDFKTARVSDELLENSAPEGVENPEEIETLYDKYVNWGIIRAEEKDGTWMNYFKAGLVYDTRDNIASPNRGMWTEAVVQYAPDFEQSGLYDHAKFTVIHRHYLPVKEETLVFAYRLAYQQTLWGDVPFYAQPILSTAFLRAATNQGLGGASTLRGILRNRVVGDGIALANVEMRYRFWNFRLWNQDLYVATNVFFDMGRVVDPIDLDYDGIDFGDDNSSDYFDEGSESFHNSVGAGLKIALNYNFVLSIDYGKALDERDGNAGTYIRLNYLF